MQYIDSHTAGEPTRVIVAGGPELGLTAERDKRALLRQEFDSLRTTAILEPRGSDVLVGALLNDPVDPSCLAGVTFFNNKGYLGMCGHGTMGVAVTLAFLGRAREGRFRIETPVGVVEVHLLTPNRVAVENVPAYRYRSGVDVNVPGMGTVRGDIAWGGNWFYLVEESPVAVRPEMLDELLACARRIMTELRDKGITGEDGLEIDHIELFGPPASDRANSKNFVLCPGGAYDRSPCGTGSSAKLACLAAEGLLSPGQTWVQESIIGSVFEAQYRWLDEHRVVPTITGEAYVTAEGTLLVDPHDPYRHGIHLGLGT
ncbi:MAG: proline racemase family protein [Planctomycetales bacterium]|nr:proline racemase family protein [Planctomycetales bacterium]